MSIQNCKTSCHYEKPNENYYKHCIEFLFETFQDFLHNKDFKMDDIIVDLDALRDIFTRVDKRKDYFRYFHNIEINEFKESAVTAYWINKLRPFSFTKKWLKNHSNKGDASLSRDHWINERFATYILVCIMKKYSPDMFIGERQYHSKKVIDEIIYSFRFRDMNKENLILFLEPFYCEYLSKIKIS